MQCVCPPSLHTPHPPIWGAGKEEKKKRGSGKKRPEKMWLGAWRLCRETGRLGALHLSRPFREFFAVLSGNAGAHLPSSCRQSSTGAPSYPKIHKHRSTCHEEKTKSEHELSRPFAKQFYFRDLSRPSISLSQKCCRTSPWLKQSIEVFFVAHVPKCNRTTLEEFAVLPTCGNMIARCQ